MLEALASRPRKDTLDSDDWASDLRLPRSTSQLRIKAHELFDPIWKTGLVSRSKAYRLLARDLGVPERKAHFGRMKHVDLLDALPVIQALRDRLSKQSDAK